MQEMQFTIYKDIAALISFMAVKMMTSCEEAQERIVCLAVKEMTSSLQMQIFQI